MIVVVLITPCHWECQLLIRLKSFVATNRLIKEGGWLIQAGRRDFSSAVSQNGIYDAIKNGNYHYACFEEYLLLIRLYFRRLLKTNNGYL